MSRTRILIMGAAGRDFHNFNTVFRENSAYEVVAFTATQIPNIEGRMYPPELAGSLYPQGIPIYPEEELVDLIRQHEIEFGIICVPDFAAQQVLELMIPAGILGVLNFAPICVKGPEGCVVNNINLVTELENIIYFVHASERTKES